MKIKLKKLIDKIDNLHNTLLIINEAHNITDNEYGNYHNLKKVREVIYQMGLEDETITQKIKVFNIEVKKYIDDVNNFGDYNDKLTTKLRLKIIKRIAIGTSYEKARKIIKLYNYYR